MSGQATRPLEARGLVKRYGEVVAVGGIDLTVERGDVYGFLGPNGAGKTTTLRIMLGLIRPQAGEVRLFGRDPQHEIPEALDGVAGFVETPHFYPYLTGRKNLELLAAFDGGEAASRIDELLALVDLTGRARDKVGGYSQGMRQRLGLAASLIRAPRLLLLDEPTNGLDPGGMRDMRRLIKRLSGEGSRSCSRRTCSARSRSCATGLRSSARGRSSTRGRLPSCARRARRSGIACTRRTTNARASSA